MKKAENENIVLREECVRYTVKDEEIEVTEKYYYDLKTNERVYDRNLAIENDISAYDEYKRKKGLLTVAEIKRIRKKYNLTQKEYALAIGVGEVTVHRFENGTIQTESIDAIMKLSRNPKNMLELITQNREKVGEEVFEKTRNNIENLLELERHKIADINYSEIAKLNFKQEDVNVVAEAVIEEYNSRIVEKEMKTNVNLSRITPLELQKHLYYINGLSLAIFDMPAFENWIMAWEHGPVIEEIYFKYKTYKGNQISTENKKIKISKGLKEIIKKVVEGYGIYSGGQLINLTHEEKPWKTTNKNSRIDNEKIREYFKAVYIDN